MSSIAVPRGAKLGRDECLKHAPIWHRKTQPRTSRDRSPGERRDDADPAGAFLAKIERLTTESAAVGAEH